MAQKSETVVDDLFKLVTDKAIMFPISLINDLLSPKPAEKKLEIALARQFRVRKRISKRKSVGKKPTKSQANQLKKITAVVELLKTYV